MIGLKLLLPFLIAVSADLVSDVSGYSYKCQKPTMGASDLPVFNIPTNYHAAIRYTNWNDSTTALIVEKNFTDFLFLQKTDRNGAMSYIVKTDGVLTYSNSTCKNTTKESVLSNIYQFNSFVENNIVNNATNLADLIKALTTKRNYTFSGISETSVVGGIDAVGWIGCMHNITGDNETGLQIEVFYAGDKSQPPYSIDYKNPVILSVHFAMFKGNEINGTITSTHYSIDIAELSTTNEENKLQEINLPTGVYCENMTLIDIPVNIPESFGANIDFINTKTKQIDSAQIMYDNQLKITSFSLDFENDKDLPVIAGVDIPKDLKQATIYRDFNFGIQYVLSKDSRICKNIEPLDTRYGDVVKNNDTISLKSSTDFLFNAEGIKFYNSGSKIIEGVNVDSYMGKKNEKDDEYIVIEVNFIQDDWSIENVKGKQLNSIIYYHRNKNNELTLETHIKFEKFINYTSTGPLWIKSTVFPCTTDSLNDNFFYINLKNASLKNIGEYGTDNVESALAVAISKAGNVSVLRVSYFMLKQNSNDETLACFILGEKSSIKPTQTEYIKPELSVTEFTKLFNDTVFKSGIIANLITENKELKSISIDKFGLLSTHDPVPPKPKFVGYSGGSMFILAVFSFIFGGGIALGTYMFYNKRRTIGSMAYQVFE